MKKKYVIIGTNLNDWGEKIFSVKQKFSKNEDDMDLNKVGFVEYQGKKNFLVLRNKVLYIHQNEVYLNGDHTKNPKERIDIHNILVGDIGMVSEKLYFSITKESSVFVFMVKNETEKVIWTSLLKKNWRITIII